jgi:hypothetical protein
MSTEIFNKNFFLAATVKFGYEELKWSVIDTVGNLRISSIPGLEISLQVNPFFENPDGSRNLRLFLDIPEFYPQQAQYIPAGNPSGVGVHRTLSLF